MSIKNHVKSKIRWEKEDLKILNPSKKQELELLELIKNSKLEVEEENVNAVVGMNAIRYCFENLTNVGEEIKEMSDEEIEESINNGDMVLTEMFYEVVALIQEMIKSLILDAKQKVKDAQNLIEAIKLEPKVDKLNSDVKEIEIQK